MQKNLEYLVLLNDIDIMMDDLAKGSDAKYREMGFDVDANEHLEKAREEMRAKCTEAMLSRYDKIRKRYGKVVARVVDGVCYGCYQRLHTDLAQTKTNTEIIPCPICGRLLYFLA